MCLAIIEYMSNALNKIRMINKMGNTMLYVSPNMGTTLASPMTFINDVSLSLMICRKLYPNGVDTLEQFLFY